MAVKTQLLLWPMCGSSFRPSTFHDRAIEGIAILGAGWNVGQETGCSVVNVGVKAQSTGKVLNLRGKSQQKVGVLHHTIQLRKLGKVKATQTFWSSEHRQPSCVCLSSICQSYKQAYTRQGSPVTYVGGRGGCLWRLSFWTLFLWPSSLWQLMFFLSLSLFCLLLFGLVCMTGDVVVCKEDPNRTSSFKEKIQSEFQFKNSWQN